MAEIVSKALEKDRELRYQSAAELRSDLRRLKRQSESGMAVPSGKRRATSASTARRFKIASALLLFAVVLAAGIFHFVHARPVRSIAVLPFVDASKDVSSEYISDGITEGVIDKLSEIPELRIMSRNSVFRFKGKQADAQAAGKEFNVQAVLTGRVAHQADPVTISAELMNVSDGSQIWGRQFRYPISDLSRVQDELATAILDKLKLHVNSSEGTRLARPATDNSEAYQLYLQGRYHWNQRTPAGIKKSIESSSRRRKKTRISHWRMPALAMRTTWAATSESSPPGKARRRPKQQPPKLWCWILGSVKLMRFSAK